MVFLLSIISFFADISNAAENSTKREKKLRGKDEARVVAGAGAICGTTLFYAMIPVDMIEEKTAKECLDKIKKELSIRLSSAEYMLWIHHLKARSLLYGELRILAPSKNAIATLNKNYMENFREIARELRLGIDEIAFVAKDEEEEIEEEEKQAGKEKRRERENPFVKKYTFENFVNAETNKFASAAARAVAENPLSFTGMPQANPLYIYGGVGLGKTHLLHAIGNYLFEHNPELSVLYTTAEKIGNDYYSSLTRYSEDKDSYRNFREKYSKLDMLLIDDIQFMQKKSGIQNLFFYIFDDLYINDKQIVLSSDRPPREINDIEDRLRSRFESGLMTDISAPDYDTRINIIKKKLSMANKKLPENIIEYIAETVSSNIRELEGALTSIVMYCELVKKEPTMAIAREILREKEEEMGQIDSDKIINRVCDYYNIPATELIGKKKTKNVVEPRMVAIYLCCKLLSLPLVTIGQIFGGRDHSSIIYSRDRIMQSIAQKKPVAKAIEDIAYSIRRG